MAEQRVMIFQVELTDTTLDRDIVGDLIDLTFIIEPRITFREMIDDCGVHLGESERVDPIDTYLSPIRFPILLPPDDRPIGFLYCESWNW